MSKLFLISLCVGGNAKEFFLFRKNLVERNIKSKRLDNKSIRSLTNLKDILKGAIYVFYIEKKDYTFEDYINLVNELEKTKKFIVLGFLNKDHLYSVEFFKSIMKEDNNILGLLRSYFNLGILGSENNKNLLSKINYANNKSIN